MKKPNLRKRSLQYFQKKTFSQTALRKTQNDGINEGAMIFCCRVKPLDFCEVLN